MTTLSLLLVSSTFGASDNVQLLVFSAPYCPACVKMEPALERMQSANYPIKKINISQYPAASRDYRVNLLPTFVVLKNGREVDRHVGMTSEKSLRNMVLKHAQDGRASRSATEAPTTTPRRRSLLDGLRGRRSRDSERDAAPTPVFRGNNSQDDPQSHLREVPRPDNSNAVAARVRIRVQDNDRIHMGSGTIIHSEPGNTIVLTCAHLVDEVSPSAQVTIEVFADGTARRYRGKTLGHDIKSDVAVMALLSDQQFPSVPLASAANAPKTKDNVFSVGCGGGSIPTRENMQIVEINRYDGPANIECSTVPQQGRSGGALFNASGAVIGVCSAADAKLNEGLYAGPDAIFAMLRRCTDQLPASINPARMYADNVSRSAAADSAGNSREPRRETLAAAEPAVDVTASSDTLPDTMAAANPRPPVSRTSPAAAVQGVTGSEVTCLIRPRTPGGKSRVVIIHRASNEFVRWLEGELSEQPRATMTTISSAVMTASELAEARIRPLSRPVVKHTSAVLPPLAPAVVPAVIPGASDPQPYRRSRHVSPRS